MTRARVPLAIIGLDGASFNLLDPLMAQGHMPHLAALRRTGWQGDLMSTQPPATLPAWTSFLTASSPGVHGVCDMFMPLPGTYTLQPATGAMRAVPTFLHHLSAAGLHVASLGVPGTYPPETVRGLCVAGFDAPGVRAVTAAGVFPRDFFPTLQRLGGWRFATFNENAPGTAARATAVDALLRDLDSKERVIRHVLAMRRWDAFFVHLQASDTAAHHLWHTYDTASPRNVLGTQSPMLPRIFARLDTLIGNMLAALPQPCRVLVVSDHGMAGAGTTAVYLNRWLQQRGLLQFESPRRRLLQRTPGLLLRQAAARLPTGAVGAALRHLPPAWAGRLMASARHNVVDYRRSEAFSFELDYAPAIWVNRRGLFPLGAVTAWRAAAIVDELEAALPTWCCPVTRAPLMESMLRRDALAATPHLLRYPDLMLVPAWPGGYRCSFLPSDGPGPAVRPMAPGEFAAPKGAGMPGVHRPAGILIAHGPGMRPAMLAPMDIADAGALVYQLLNVPHPAFVDANLARVRALWPTPRRRQRAAQHVVKGDDASPYTPRQQQDLLRRLHDMGYV